MDPVVKQGYQWHQKVKFEYCIAKKRAGDAHDRNKQRNPAGPLGIPAIVDTTYWPGSLKQ